MSIRSRIDRIEPRCWDWPSLGWAAASASLWLLGFLGPAPLVAGGILATTIMIFRVHLKAPDLTRPIGQETNGDDLYNIGGCVFLVLFVLSGFSFYTAADVAALAIAVLTGLNLARFNASVM